ncbi:MAG: DUF4364 family protein [Lachnospiraceae bacterium]|nr:DUF4364 family protein [Lachnospiraceae bacterium]
MNTETSTLYKLIILYMLDKSEYPLTNSDISNLILDMEYTNYFTLQQAISDLETSDLISAESTTSNTTLYRITSGGQTTLNFFEDKISDAIKEDIHRYYVDNEIELKKDTSVTADYYKLTGQQYNVRCQIKDKNMVSFELSFHIQGKEQAEAACKNWKEKNSEVYAYLMDMLIQ